MCIEGDDVIDPHVYQLLKSDGTVEGFAGSSLVLAALIEERHDNRDPAGLTAYRSDDPLKILEMIIGRHVVLMSAEGIGLSIVQHINKDVQIGTSYGFKDDTLSFAGSESRYLGSQKV